MVTGETRWQGRSRANHLADPSASHLGLLTLPSPSLHTSKTIVFFFPLSFLRFFSLPSSYHCLLSYPSSTFLLSIYLLYTLRFLSPSLYSSSRHVSSLPSLTAPPYCHPYLFSLSVPLPLPHIPPYHLLPHSSITPALPTNHTYLTYSSPLLHPPLIRVMNHQVSC